MQSLERDLRASAVLKKQVPHSPGPSSCPGLLPEANGPQDRGGDAAGALQVREDPTRDASGQKRSPL